MAIVAKFTVSNMSSQQYETVLERLSAAGVGAPPGRLYHVSYGDQSNLQVIDIYESPAAFEEFGKTLVPILMEMGIQAVPEVSPAYKVVQG
jgi:hypothetical protein